MRALCSLFGVYKVAKVNFPQDAFQKWYWFDQYGIASTRGMWMGDNPTEKFMHDMVEAAFLQGCRWMAQETLDTLGDYACAVEGLKPETITPAQKYDDARESLMVYFTKVLDDMDVETKQGVLQ